MSIRIRNLSLLLLLSIFFTNVVLAQSKLNLDLIFDGKTFVEKRVPGFRVLNNNQHYAVLENSSEGLEQINLYNLQNRKKVPVHITLRLTRLFRQKILMGKLYYS